ncbi:MAG: hypothetical protein IJP20_00395 [Clostridia bacterium]|nr:hypothetical protein [Clostridia bacterium]
MNFDKRSLDRLLSLDDAELSQIIREIAAEAGVDASGISLGEAELKKLRTFLSLASADDIARLISGLGGGKNG